MLSLVACGLGIAFVTDATRWRCPRNVVLRKVVDLRLPIAVSLVWRGQHVAVAREIRDGGTATPTGADPGPCTQRRRRPEV